MLPDATNPRRESFRRRLYDDRPAGGPTTRTIDAELAPDGSLAVIAQDVGEAPLAAFGDGDYEFWVRVDSEQRAALLLALLAERFGGRFDAVDEFRAWLAAQGIPGEFHSY